MRLREASNVRRGVRVIEILKSAVDVTSGFDVRKIITPIDLRAARESFSFLVSQGRLFNASRIVSGLTVAFGEKPREFNDVDITPFKTFVDNSGFAAEDVLANFNWRTCLAD